MQQGDLLDYATHEFSLLVTDKDGVSRRKHLERAAKRKGVTPAGLIAPDFPESLRHVWEWFWELSNTRQPAFSGIAAISFQEIKAWSQLMDVEPTPSEIELIRMLDTLFKRTLEDGNRDERDKS